MKQKLNKKDFMFSGIENQTLKKFPGQINGLDFVISNLKNCTVYLGDHLAQIFIDDCIDCKIYTGPIEGSIFIRDSQNVTFSSASNQLRISDSNNITGFCYSSSDPALENCSNIMLGPYNFSYPKILEHFEKAKLHINPTQDNHWSHVYDFTPNTERPNWGIISPHDFPNDVFESFDTDVEGNAMQCPVPRNVIYGGSIQDPLKVGSAESNEDTAGIFQFTIHTTQAEAQAQIEETQKEVKMQNVVEVEDAWGEFDQIGSTVNKRQKVISIENEIETNIQNPEEEISQLEVNKLEKIERLMMSVIKQKQNEETLKRNEKVEKAQKYKAEQRQLRQGQIQARVLRNREDQKIRDQNSILQQGKNDRSKGQDWQKIYENIDLKADANLTKDLTRMKESIVNRKNDSTSQSSSLHSK